MNVVFVFLVF